MALNYVSDHAAVAYRGTSEDTSGFPPGSLPASANVLRGVGLGNAIGTSMATVPLRGTARAFHPYLPSDGGSRRHQDAYDDPMDSNPTLSYTQVERVQTLSMHVPDHSMTRQVIDEAEWRHDQFRHEFHVAHCQSVTGIVALAREALQELSLIHI